MGTCSTVWSHANEAAGAVLVDRPRPDLVSAPPPEGPYGAYPPGGYGPPGNSPYPTYPSDPAYPPFPPPGYGWQPRYPPPPGYGKPPPAAPEPWTPGVIPLRPLSLSDIFNGAAVYIRANPRP